LLALMWWTQVSWARTRLLPSCGTMFWNIAFGATQNVVRPTLEDGNDYYYPFATYAEALAFSERTEGAEAPLALIRQREYVAEPNPGEYLHVKQERITEWPVQFLSRPRRTQNTIPDFLHQMLPPNGSIYCGV
jgi:hypothetical protein